MRHVINIPIALSLMAAIAFALVGCTNSSPPVPSTAQTVPGAKATDQAHEDGHGHKPGAHGGHIVSLGRDSYHVEAIVTKDGKLLLYTLGNDESKVLDIDAQPLTAYVKAAGATDSTPIQVEPKPQPGDASGKASLFIGELPTDAVGKAVDVTIPSLAIEGERFRLNFSTHVDDDHGAGAMPDSADGAEARALYLTPGGIYTAADIEANGGVTAAEKFKGVMASHDLKPKPGDKICPVTLTKANPKFSWVIAGKTYEFCCPPCIDEFVGLAKSAPDEIKEPEEYVKQAAATGNDKR